MSLTLPTQGQGGIQHTRAVSDGLVRRVSVVEDGGGWSQLRLQANPKGIQRTRRWSVDGRLVGSTIYIDLLHSRKGRNYPQNVRDPGLRDHSLIGYSRHRLVARCVGAADLEV
jgi:hypothetical protein